MRATGRSMLASALAVSVLLLALPAALGQEVEPTAAMPHWRGTWRDEGQLPGEARFGASVSVEPAARNGVTVWGGVTADGRLLNDGIEIHSGDPSRSQAIPPAPISGRRDHGWASRFGEVYVWGGTDAAGEPLADGAEFGTDWTLMPESPLSPGPAAMTVVENELWVASSDSASGEAVLSSIRVPLEDGRGWSTPTKPPVPPGDRYDLVGCCDEEAQWLFVFSLSTDSIANAAAFDYGSRTWTEVGPVPVPPPPAAGPVSGRAIEDDLTAWIGSVADPDAPDTALGSAGVFFSRRQPQDPWVVTEVTPTPALRLDDSIVLGPSHLISVREMQAYDLVDGEWLGLPVRGVSGSREWRENATAWWDRGKLWVLDGHTDDGDGQPTLHSFTPRPANGSFALPTGRRPSTEGRSCVLYGKEGKWRLRGDATDPRLVWLQRGKRQAEIDWPDGWRVRFDPKLVITDSAGEVRYRGGDRCPAVKGTGG